MGDLPARAHAHESSRIRDDDDLRGGISTSPPPWRKSAPMAVDAAVSLMDRKHRPGVDGHRFPGSPVDSWSWTNDTRSWRCVCGCGSAFVRDQHLAHSRSWSCSPCSDAGKAHANCAAGLTFPPFRKSSHVPCEGALPNERRARNAGNRAA